MPERERTPVAEPEAEDMTLGREAEQQATVSKDKVTVRIAQLGRDTVEVTGEPGMTVAQALNKAGLSIPQGLELRVNNSSCGTDRELKDGEIIMLIPRIVGGGATEMVVTISNPAGELLDVMWFNRH